MEGRINVNAGEGSSKDNSTSIGNPLPLPVSSQPTVRRESFGEPAQPSVPVQKQHRIQSPGAEKKHQKKSKKNSGDKGLAFSSAFHRLIVKEGEDVSTEIMSFAEQCPHSIFIISGVGNISYAKISHAHQVGNPSLHTDDDATDFEGKFDIGMLRGAFMRVNGEGSQFSGCLNINFTAGSFLSIWGIVAGQMIAASPVVVYIIEFPDTA